jgi:hypothetical protein
MKKSQNVTDKAALHTRAEKVRRRTVNKKDLPKFAKRSKKMDIKFEVNDPDYLARKAENDAWLAKKEHEKRQEAAQKAAETRRQNDIKRAERDLFLKKVEKMEQTIARLEAARKMAKTKAERKQIATKLKAAKKEYRKLNIDDTRRIHGTLRTLSAIKRDQKNRSKRIANDWRWLENPGQYDYEGVDTPGSPPNPYLANRIIADLDVKSAKARTKAEKAEQRRLNKLIKERDRDIAKIEKERIAVEKKLAKDEQNAKRKSSKKMAELEKRLAANTNALNANTKQILRLEEEHSKTRLARVKKARETYLKRREKILEQMTK